MAYQQLADYQLLDIREEEELYKTRLLNVEEKPFKRITKRLATLRDVVAVSARQEQTPPPEGAELEADTVPGTLTDEIALLAEDVTLDFAALDASVSRLQFLHTANERERARYAADRGSILNTCQAVRENMTVLRTQLDQARATLAQRKIFDDMADRITSSRTLRPRPDQQASILKLEEECRQLQRDGEAYTATWRERRAQFNRIMEESMVLRRQIRDEKEEVERREGMDEEEGGGNHGKATSGGAAGATPTPADSANAVPRLVGGGIGDGDGANSPMPGSMAGSQARDSPAPVDYEGGLRPESGGGGSSFFSRADSRAESRAESRGESGMASREGSPGQAESTVPEREEGEEDEEEEGDDVDMVEAGETGETGEVDEGEAGSPGSTTEATPQEQDKMDTT